jgi:hypothetical protein
VVILTVLGAAELKNRNKARPMERIVSSIADTYMIGLQPNNSLNFDRVLKNLLWKFISVRHNRKFKAKNGRWSYGGHRKTNILLLLRNFRTLELQNSRTSKVCAPVPGRLCFSVEFNCKKI